MSARVCIITTVHPSFDTRIFYKEAKTLVDARYDITLIAQHNKDETIDGIKIIALPKPKNRFFRIFFLTRKTYKLALQQKADIYHFHDPELIPAGLLLKLFTKSKSKIIYDVHEDVPKQILSKYWLFKTIRKPISILFNWFEKVISQKFDYIITTTPNIRKNFGHHTAVDIRNYPLVADSGLFKNYIFPKNKNYYNLIYIGGLEKIRGIKEIVRSLKFMSPKYNVKLKLAGKFSDRNFKKEIENLKEWNRIEFRGWIPPEEVRKELSKADIGLVCLYPLRRFLTSLSVKMFEYMAAGLPVIASNFPLWKEIIEGNECGICVNPLNPEKIAKTVEYLIEHPEEAKRMGENGRKAVLEKYNWDSEKEKLFRLYSSLEEKNKNISGI